MSNEKIGGPSESIRYSQRVKRILLLFIVVVFGVLGISGCNQTESVPTEGTPQEVQVHTELPAEPIRNPEPVSEPPEPAALPQPQTDGSGICFEIPEEWSQYPTDALRDLQSMIDNAGNRVLYGVLHGYMESQETVSVSLVDSNVEDYEYMISYELAYDVSLDDGTGLRLTITATGWEAEEDGSTEIYFDNIDSADVYPAFENYYWSLDCEDMEGVDDWVYQVIAGNIAQYYSISDNSLQEYTMFDDYNDYSGYYGSSDSGNTDSEEPIRLTQYNWPDYCNEMDCLMMEAVGLQYNEQWGTATKLLTSGALITISIVPKIGGGVEYGANVKIEPVNGISSVPVKSSDGIHYQCKSTMGKDGNAGGYSGLWITLTKDGWSNWY